MRRAVLCLLTLCLVVPFAALHAEEPEPKSGDWSVDDPPLGAHRELAFDTTEGTWMSVDVHPDGKTLVFDLMGDLYTLPIEGGTATCIASGLAYAHQPRWSPDGSRIAFTSDGGGGDNVWICDPDGGNARAVTDEDFRLLNNPVWHPDGAYVVAKKHFTSRRSLGAGEMWLYRVPESAGKTAGKGVQLTTRKNDQQDVGEPALSPDGRFLYWSEDMSGGRTFQYNKDPHQTIYVIRCLDLDSGEIRELIRRPGGAVRPTPSPDGNLLAYVRREGDATVLALHDPHTGKSRDLWDGLSRDQQETWAIFGPYPGFDWTPDGASIVIWAKGKLHRVNVGGVADGSVSEIPFQAPVRQTILPTRRIEHSVAQEAFDVKVVRWPSWTDDGKRIVFQALGYLHVKDRASGEVRRLTSQTDHFEFAPRLAPDGASVVYTTWNDRAGGTVRRIGLDGSGARVLVDWPGHYASADLSADGKEVVFHRTKGDGQRGETFGGEPGIYRAPVDGSKEPRFLVRSGRLPRFAPGGRRIHLLDSEGDGVALVSIDRIGSDRRVVATSEHARDFAVSPDGRWLAFEELWQTYLVPLPRVPKAIHVGPTSKELPVRRLSRTGGTYLTWSRDSKAVRWSLGPDGFEATVADVKASADPDRKPEAKLPAAERGVGAASVRIGWSVPADVPETDVYLVGGRIAPMHDESVIEDGVVHVRGNRIVAVGNRADVPVPEGATTLDVTGKTVMPGLVDTHSHTFSAASGLQPQQNWMFTALLAFGVTTVHDPSNDTQAIYAESEMVRAGSRLGPRVLSTGTILYGAEGSFKAVVNSYEDALQEIGRTIAWGPVSVKSYNLPRRNQRQQVLAAAAKLGIMVMPEGGSTYVYNLTQFQDGHTTIEHAIPIAPLYEPELRLMAESGTAYTPTLVVGYGGLWGENYWYAKTPVHEHERLLRFVPASVVLPRARRRTLATDEDDYYHVRLASTAAEVYRRGGMVTTGAHGQLQGLGTHWEAWMLQQGGLTPHQALRCATYLGAKAICLDHELGSVRPGLLADLIVVDGDPLANVQDSEKVVYTMANGRVFDAATLTQLFPEERPLPAGPDVGTSR